MDGADMELKLRLEPDEMARLRRRGPVKTLKKGAPATLRFRSVYWDTPDFNLAAAGVVVRTRTDGRQHVVTIKTAGKRGAGLHARREWEWPGLGGPPEQARLASTGLAVLAEPGLAARLRPVFLTDFTRTLYRLGGDEWEVTLALDRGTIGAGNSCEAICEAELELAAGPPHQLFAVAREVAAAVPARLSALAKSDRGYRLAAGSPPLPVKAEPTRIRANMTVAEAFRTIARNCLDHLLANEHCLLATRDPEAVHQMRVALRRLRSAIRVFRDAVDGPGLAAVEPEIGWLLTQLGRARDGHVFLHEIVDPVVSTHPGNGSLAALRAAWLADNEKTLKVAIDAVAGRRFTAMLLDVAAWIEAGDWQSPARPLLDADVGAPARTVLAQRDRRLRRAGGDRLSVLSPEDLHAVRIRAKQLRYAGEFFAPLWSKKVTRGVLDGLAELQDVLGQLNDIAVARSRLTLGTDHGLDEADPCLEGDIGRAWATGLIAGWHAGRRPHLLHAAEKAWKRYRKAERFWERG